MVGRLLLLAIASASVASMSRCAAPPSMKAGDANDLSSPTRGVAVLLEERIPGRSIFRRYELHPDGTLKVGGGAAARDRRTEWSGTPSDDDLTAMLDAIDASGIATGPPACAPVIVDGEETIFTRVEYAAPSGTIVHELHGRCPALDPLRAAFEKASLVRFDRQLDRLPEAGPQPNRIVR
jgi:hypothetical protein